VTPPAARVHSGARVPDTPPTPTDPEVTPDAGPPAPAVPDPPTLP
jgi:hypothetical protein